MTITKSNLNRFKKIVTGKFLGKFVVKWILKLPLSLAYVATLPCETLMSAKQAINDKLHKLHGHAAVSYTHLTLPTILRV